MKSNKGFLFINLLLLVSAASTFGQPKNKDAEIGLPKFTFIGITSPLPDRENIQVDLQISISYNEIQFLRTAGVYQGEYEVGITFKDKDETKIAGRIVKRILKTDSYDRTRDENGVDVITEPFVLPAKDLKVIIRVTDLDTRKTSYQDDSRDYSNYYSKSSVLGDVGIIKTESSTADSTGKHPVFWGSQLPEPLDTLHFQACLLGEKGPYEVQYRLLKDETPIYYFNTKIESVLPIDSLLQLDIPTTNMSFGNYALELSVRDGSGATVASRAKFRVHWQGVSGNIQNMTTAIRQLRYIASDKELNKMLKAKADEQRKMFLEFWRSKDPTPTSTQNELMDEYYRRVRFADEHYSGVREGWQTDMGAIYILFGPPDEIERRPFEIDSKPYEVWYYFDINQQFVFIDLTGFGEYRLSEPFNFQRNWEYHP